METIETIKTAIEDLEFGYFDYGEDILVPLETIDDFKEFIKRENWQIELFDAIGMFKADLKEKLKEDLISIWNRLDRLEK